MQPENEKKDVIIETQQKMVVIWGALMSSQFIFLMVLYFIKKELFHFDFSQPLAGSNPMLVGIAGVLSLTTFGLSFAMKGRLVKQAEAEQNVALVQTGHVVAYALCESISLLGFMLAMLIGYQYFFLWFAGGIFGILLHFPRQKYIARAVYKHEL
ncbi:MAG TPA: hypothetical protein VGO50_06395 [Pyrinomonadaceae bacterium]|jgi:hypothetical protein|nr:hypothetical protein [Pyrinomonadaceae bacterium]